jgi:hypothetical protein
LKKTQLFPACGLKELTLSKCLCHEKQYTGSAKSLSKFQWYFHRKNMYDGMLFSYKERMKFLSSTGKWMELEYIMLSVASQVQKGTGLMFAS